MPANRAYRSTAINVMAGICHPGSAANDYDNTYLGSLRYACSEAAALGLQVLIDPLNHVDRPAYYLSSQAQAHDIIRIVGADNLYVMMDLYHAQMSEGNLAAKLRSYLPRIGHIQIADVPGRHQPGTGELNYSFLLDSIDLLGYSGRIGCEYIPLGGTDISLQWAYRYGLARNRLE